MTKQAGRSFDINKPFWVTADYAAVAIQDAWIGQYLSDTLISQLIRLGTGGVHSHSAMFIRAEHKVDVLDMVSSVGGQRRTLEYHVKQPQRIDVFSPDVRRWPQFNAYQATVAMRMLTDYDYGWGGIFESILRRLPFFYGLFPPSTDDRLPEQGEPVRQPYCSHAVSLATHLGGGVDPVPRCPHWLVTPSQLTYSLFYNYQFTIASPWCVKRYGKQVATEAETNTEYLEATHK